MQNNSSAQPFTAQPFTAQQGYEHYYQMLNDKVRMDAYRKAIFK